MLTQKFSTEKFLFFIAVLAAALLRFTNLGQLPLNDQEARLALQSLQIARGNIPTLLNQPLLILFNSFLFFLFSSTNFLARFLPALSGTLLILPLYWLRTRIHPRVILLLAFAFAIDPGLVSLSRTLDSTIPALALLFFTTTFWLNKKYSFSGIAAALLILCGSAGVFAILTFGLATLISLGFEKQLQIPHPDHPLFGNQRQLTAQIKPFFISLVISLLLVSTWFFHIPQGISTSIGGLVDFFKGWTTASFLPAGWIILALGLYQPIAVVFAAIALLHTYFSKSEQNQSDGFERFLSIWFLIAFLLILIYPDRQISGLIWAIIPLWIIAAREIDKLLFPLEQPSQVPLLQGIIVFFFLVLFGLQVAAYSLIFPINRLDWVHLAAILSTLLLIGLVFWLVNIAWTRRAAYQGLALGWIMAMLIFTLAGTFGSAFSLPHSQIFRQELWRSYPQIGDTDLLLNTIHDLSSWNSGNVNDLAVTMAVDSPALQWLLRGQQSLTILPEENALAILATQDQPHPALLITRQVADKPSGTTAYRGSDFNWWIPPPWSANALLNPLDWILYRRAAWQPETILLWARGDLFPGGLATSSAQNDLNSNP